MTVLDTAGIRETDDPVEQEGVRRASEQAASADLVLWVRRCSRAVDAQAVPSVRASIEAPTGCALWVVVNKIDLVGTTRTAKS